MNCYNTKCKKPIIKALLCYKCQKKVCSNECMIQHTYDFHQKFDKESIKQSNIIKSLQCMKPKSIFVKKGEYLKIIKNDPLFDYRNFEFVKIGNKKQVLGTGAFGEVYLAKNKVNGSHYAIKHMHKKKITDHGANLEIVLREINIHKRLIHDNIIRMYSSYEDKNSFYLIMDYANNHTVFSLIKKKNGMSENEAFKYFIDTVAAVNFLHENNLVHRDLKPENLLIDEKGSIKLCDFGWCVELAVGNRSTFCGTYEYMAPEIINETPYDNGIDVWSLGVLLYELLHGYSPFRAKVMKSSEREYIEIFRNIVSLNFKIEKDISEPCIDLINKLLTPNSKNRLKVNEIFTHPWVNSFEKEYRNHKMYQGSKIQGLNLHITNNEPCRTNNTIEEDNDNFFENNRFQNQLDNSKNIDLNRSFDSSCKINNDLRKLNNIMNNSSKKVNKEINFSKNTIQNNQSMSYVEENKKKNCSIEHSNKANISTEPSKMDKIYINTSEIDKKENMENSSLSESMINKNIKEFNSDDKIKLKNEKQSEKVQEKICIEKPNLIVEELKNEEIIKHINIPEERLSGIHSLTKEREEQLLKSKEKLQKCIDTSKLKLMEDLNLKLSNQDETIKMSFCRNSQGSLFDKVLNQVQMKNRTKKYHKINEVEDSFENRCIIQNTNKIFIIAEKPNNIPEIKVDKSNNFSIVKDDEDIEILQSKPEINQKSCLLIDKLMIEKQNQKENVMSINNVANANIPSGRDVKRTEVKEKPKDSIELFRNSNNELDPKVYNELLIFEKENNHPVKVEISNLSGIEINYSDIHKVSNTVMYMETISPANFLETPKNMKLEINRMEFQISSSYKNTEERLRYLEKTLKLHKLNNNIDIINWDDGQENKIESKVFKERDNLNRKQQNNDDKDRYNDDYVRLRTKSKKKYLSSNNDNLMQNEQNDFVIKNEKKIKNDSKTIRNKISRENNKKVLKLKVYEKKEKNKKINENEKNNSENDILSKSSLHESNVILYASIEILEKSLDNKNKLIKLDDGQANKTFWTKLNPFQCGNYQ